MLRVTINNQDHELPAGGSILDALRTLGIEVPTLCHDPRIVPTGACRLCSVELRGQDRLVASCTTPLTDGMVIETHSAAAESDRKTNLMLLAQHYPTDEPF